MLWPLAILALSAVLAVLDGETELLSEILGVVGYSLEEQRPEDSKSPGRHHPGIHDKPHGGALVEMPAAQEEPQARGALDGPAGDPPE